MSFALNGLYWFHKKTVNHFFQWRKKIVMNVDACVCFFNCKKKGLLCVAENFAARGIFDNFEISLAVLLPNTTTSHAITYTNLPKFLGLYYKLVSLN